MLLFQLHSLGIKVDHEKVFRFTVGFVLVALSMLMALEVLFLYYVRAGEVWSAEEYVIKLIAGYYFVATNGVFVWFGYQCDNILFAVFMRFYGLNHRFS